MDEKMVVITLPEDDWEAILDYIYANLEYDNHDKAGRDINAAMNNIRRVHDQSPYEG